MTAPALLAELQGRGVAVALSGDSLQFDAPRGAMRDLLPEVARLKPALLELLSHGDRYAPSAASGAAARFWADVAEAIEQSRRGAHLAYTPALAWAWGAANFVTKCNLSAAQLCEVALESDEAPQD
jgi:hypothetical protein